VNDQYHIRRPSIEIEQMTKKNRENRREKALARRADDDTVVAHWARVLGILAILSTSGGKKRSEFVNRDVNAALNIRQCAML
jgi:hypothetical protein